MFHALSTHLPNRRSTGSVRSAAKNGHVLCNGKTLKEFKLQFAHLINEASKTTQFGFPILEKMSTKLTWSHYYELIEYALEGIITRFT